MGVRANLFFQLFLMMAFRGRLRALISEKKGKGSSLPLGMKYLSFLLLDVLKIIILSNDNNKGSC